MDNKKKYRDVVKHITVLGNKFYTKNFKEIIENHNRTSFLLAKCKAV